MKKLFPLIIVILFIGFVILGFKAASALFPNKNSLQSANGTSVPSVTQQNDFLFLVDDMSTDDPQLIAIWIVLNYPSTPPQLMFLPLYPSSNNETNHIMESVFALSKEKLLSDRALKKIKNTFAMDAEGYFITDNTGVLRFAAYAGIDTIGIFNQPAQTTDAVLAIQNSGRLFFSSICQLFSTGASNSFFSQVDWSSLIPAHFSTNISFEELTKLIDKINSYSSNQCLVLAE